jgi:hypothetical protein
MQLTLASVTIFCSSSNSSKRDYSETVISDEFPRTMCQGAWRACRASSCSISHTRMVPTSPAASNRPSICAIHNAMCQNIHGRKEVPTQETQPPGGRDKYSKMTRGTGLAPVHDQSRPARPRRESTQRLPTSAEVWWRRRFRHFRSLR